MTNIRYDPHKLINQDIDPLLNIIDFERNEENSPFDFEINNFPVILQYKVCCCHYHRWFATGHEHNHQI